MIYLEIKGRLGNQLFRYAFARYLQIQRGYKDKLVLGFSNMKGKNPDEGWDDSLKYFNVVPYETCDKRLVYVFGNLIQKILNTMYLLDMRILAHNTRKKRKKHAKRWMGPLAKFGVINNENEYYDYPIPTTRNVIIDGDFQCSKYFNSIRDVLIKEFTPKSPPLKGNEKFYKIITETNSVCISIRRGDYVSVPEFNKLYNICSEQFYQKAVDRIKKEVNNPTLILFSDDIEWAKSNLKFDIPTYYESGNDSLGEKVRLMSACKHFIISNSSFSWWVQYLGNDPNKVVISPNRWYNGDFPADLIEDSFIKIKV